MREQTEAETDILHSQGRKVGGVIACPPILGTETGASSFYYYININIGWPSCQHVFIIQYWALSVAND